MINKRGLSDVVTVALIVLLAIAAVVIVWTFVRSTLEDIGEQVTATCVNINIRPVGSCNATTGKVSVENTAGGKIVDSIKLIFYDNTGNSVVRDGSCLNMEPLATMDCTPATAPGNNPDKVSAAAVIGTVTCPITSGSINCAP